MTTASESRNPHPLDACARRAHDGALAQLSPDTLARLPGPPSTSYPEGLPFTQALSDGSMSVELYAPGSNADGRDRQQLTTCGFQTDPVEVPVTDV